MATKVLNLISLLLIGVAMMISSASGEYHCGRQQSCYMLPTNCSYGTCDYEVVWSMSADGSKLNLKMAATTTGWVGVGFSSDTLMGDDHVLMCMKDVNSTAKFEHRFNQVGKTNIPQEMAGITVSDLRYTDGAISCRVERDISLMSGGKKFNLSSTDYYMFFARGPLINGIPVQHEVIPPVTSAKVDFSDILIVSTMADQPTPPDTDDDNGTTAKHAGILLVVFSVLLGLMGSN